MLHHHIEWEDFTESNGKISCNGEISLLHSSVESFKINFGCMHITLRYINGIDAGISLLFV